MTKATVTFVDKGATDTSGNVYTKASGESVEFEADQTQPEVAITRTGGSGRVGTGTVVNLSFTWSRAVNSFDKSKVIVSTGSVLSDLAQSGNIYTGTLTVGGTGSVVVEVATGTVIDSFSKYGNQQASLTLERDEAKPTVIISREDGGGTVGLNTEVPFVAEFSSAVAGLSESGIDIAGAGFSVKSGSLQHLAVPDIDS